MNTGMQYDVYVIREKKSLPVSRTRYGISVCVILEDIANEDKTVFAVQ